MGIYSDLVGERGGDDLKPTNNIKKQNKSHFI